MGFRIIQGLNCLYKSQLDCISIFARHSLIKKNSENHCPLSRKSNAKVSYLLSICCWRYRIRVVLYGKLKAIIKERRENKIRWWFKGAGFCRCSYLALPMIISVRCSWFVSTSFSFLFYFLHVWLVNGSVPRIGWSKAIKFNPELKSFVTFCEFYKFWTFKI